MRYLPQFTRYIAPGDIISSTRFLKTYGARDTEHGKLYRRKNLLDVCLSIDGRAISMVTVQCRISLVEKIEFGKSLSPGVYTTWYTLDYDRPRFAVLTRGRNNFSVTIVMKLQKKAFGLAPSTPLGGSCGPYSHGWKLDILNFLIRWVLQ